MVSSLWRQCFSMIDGRRVLAICIVLSVLRIKKRGYFLKKRNYEFCLLYASSLIGRAVLCDLA